MGTAFVKNTTFHLQVGQQKKKQSKLFVVPAGLNIYIFFKGYGSLPKKADLCPIWGRFGHKCVPREKTSTLNPTGYRNKVFGYGNVVQDHFGGDLGIIKGPGRYMLWLKTQLLILQVYPLKNKSKLRSSTCSFEHEVILATTCLPEILI